MQPPKYRRNINPALIKKIRAQKKIEEKHFKKDNMSFIHLAMVVCYFGSNTFIINKFSQLDLSILGLIKIIALLIALSLLIPIKLYRKWLTISIYEYIILNFIAIAPLLCASVIITNELFKGEKYSESYRIVNSEWVKGKTIFYLENDVYQEKEYLRSIKDNEEFIKDGVDNFSIYFYNGLFGIRIIDKKRVY